MPHGLGNNGRRNGASPASAGVATLPDLASQRPPEAEPLPHLATGARDLEERVRVDGKFFALGAERFEFRGVTYGTFAERADGALYPPREQVQRDLAVMDELGFNVLRTYTVPPEDVLEAAGEQGMRVLAGVFYPDWRYLLGGSRRERRAIARDARRAVEEASTRLAGDPRVLGLSLGNEIPADVLRWYGLNPIADALRSLVETVREADPGQLVTYANYPTAEYLPLGSLDFLTFNVFLERRADFRRYLTRLHHLAGDRPLVLGELGLNAGNDADGERKQAESLDWQLETAVERGVAGTCVFSWTDEWWVGGERVSGWSFGLTRADRSSRPALEVATRWNQRTVRDLDFSWPRITVVICAHNSEETLDECLRHTCQLDYPDLEVLVVDDGSTDATAEIAARHSRARLVQIPHSGLAAARNEGYQAARGDLIAYLDADAYPAPEWPYYLALGLDAPDVGGVGGPNVPPITDPEGAQVVARSPGGPVHVLVSDDRAEHVPGCNMAFWKIVLEEVDGFDPIYTAAGDDVDLCWRTLNRDWEIGFHPAALVWHHRRPGLGTYLRQQRSYGRSEALVEARHPERFNRAGTARWRGRIYNSLAPSLTPQRIYRGIYGTAPYQSVYQGGGHLIDLIHQVGVPAAALLLLSAPLAFISPWLAIPAAVALIGLLVLAGVDMARATPRRGGGRGRLRFCAMVATHHILQPLVRLWARNRHRHHARRERARALDAQERLPAPVKHLRGGVVVVPEDRPRAQLAATLIDALRYRGVHVSGATGWEDCDARFVLSALTIGELQTSSHPEGYVQVRIKARPRWRLLAASAAVAAGAATIALPLGALVVLPAGSLLIGALRARQLPGRVFGGGPGMRGLG